MKYIYIILLTVAIAVTSFGQSNFQNTILTNAFDYISVHLPEGVNNTKSSAFEITSPLKLKYDADVTAYFVYSGAKYHDSFGIGSQTLWTNVLGVTSGASRDLGTFIAGSLINSFIIADEDSIYNNKHTYYSDNSINSDFNQHCAVFTPDVFGVTNSPYILLAFEDLYGGGYKDINDVVIALNVGVANVNFIESVPEPKILECIGLGIVIMLMRGYLRHAP